MTGPYQACRVGAGDLHTPCRVKRGITSIDTCTISDSLPNRGNKSSTGATGRDASSTHRRPTKRRVGLGGSRLPLHPTYEVAL